MKSFIVLISLLSALTASATERMRGGIAISQLRETNFGQSEDEHLTGENSDGEFCAIRSVLTKNDYYIIRIYNDGQDVVQTVKINANKYVQYKQEGDSGYQKDTYYISNDTTVSLTTFEDISDLKLEITLNGETVDCIIRE